MFTDLLTFTTPKYQRASMMVALLQLVLKQCGETENAQRLEGLDVTGQDMAKVALEILTAMRPQGDEASHTRGLAINSLREAMVPETPVFHYAN